jgi:hypothetical protein
MNLNEENNAPTPFPEVNVVLRDLLKGVQRILDNHLVGKYLEGSLAIGESSHLCCH